MKVYEIEAHNWWVMCMCSSNQIVIRTGQGLDGQLLKEQYLNNCVGVVIQNNCSTLYLNYGNDDLINYSRGGSAFIFQIWSFVILWKIKGQNKERPDWSRSSVSYNKGVGFLSILSIQCSTQPNLLCYLCFKIHFIIEAGTSSHCKVN